MLWKRIGLLLAACFLWEIGMGQDDAPAPYEYDTVLRGGYFLSFRVDDSLQYLDLKKGSRKIGELWSCSRGVSYNMLGFVGADFRDQFVLVHGAGSGNPNYIDLFRKRDAKSLLPNMTAWIDANEDAGVLLYCDNDVPDAGDRMTLRTIATGREETFPFPKDVFGGPQVLNRIRIRRITATRLVIEYETDSDTREKSYVRRISTKAPSVGKRRTTGKR